MKPVRVQASKVMRAGSSLPEVLVVVGCLAVLALLFLPWLLTSRESSRGHVCLTRIQALGEAVILSSENHANFVPYFVQDQGWPVEVSEYLKDKPGWNEGRRISEEELKSLSVPMYVCPDDPRAQNQTGALSYVINGGYGFFPVDANTQAVSETGTHSAGLDLDHNGEVSAEEWAVNYATGVCWRPDTRPEDEAFRMSFPEISEADGTKFTLLMSENLNAGAWYSKETRDLAFVIGREQIAFAKAPNDNQTLKIEAIDLGPFAINGNFGTLSNQCPAPSSLHGDSVNMIYCDGHGGPMSSKIDPYIYASLLTSNGSAYGQGD